MTWFITWIMLFDILIPLMAVGSAVKFYIQLMVILSVVALISSSKTKETEIKQITEVLQQAADGIKKMQKQKIGMIKFLALTFYLLDRLIQNLILVAIICWLLLKSQFEKEINLVLWNFESLSEFLIDLYEPY